LIEPKPAGHAPYCSGSQPGDTGKFRAENPKTFQAVVDAFREATVPINTDRHKAC
jgi:hypothetical protein